MLTGFSIALFVGLLFINSPKTVEPMKVSVKLETDSLIDKTLKPQIISKDTILKSDTIKNQK